MSKLYFSGKFKWILVLGLALLLLTSFIACSDGPLGVIIIEEEQEDEKGEEDNTPESPTNFSQIFDIQGVGAKYC